MVTNLSETRAEPFQLVFGRNMINKIALKANRDQIQQQTGNYQELYSTRKSITTDTINIRSNKLLLIFPLF
jgi:hypothetical protein